jgi:hypothetical protein
MESEATRERGSGRVGINKQKNEDREKRDRRVGQQVSTHLHSWSSMHVHSRQQTSSNNNNARCVDVLLLEHHEEACIVSVLTCQISTDVTSNLSLSVPNMN